MRVYFSVQGRAQCRPGTWQALCTRWLNQSQRLFGPCFLISAQTRGKEPPVLTLQLESTNQLRLCAGVGKFEAIAMPLTSVVWPMRAFCSGEVNPRAARTLRTGRRALGHGQFPKAQIFCFGGGPSIHTHWHWASVWLHQGLRRSRQISMHGLLLHNAATQDAVRPLFPWDLGEGPSVPNAGWFFFLSAPRFQYTLFELFMS